MGGEFHRLGSIGGLADHLDIRIQTQNRSQALAHTSQIVSN